MFGDIMCKAVIKSKHSEKPATEVLKKFWNLKQPPIELGFYFFICLSSNKEKTTPIEAFKLVFKNYLLKDSYTEKLIEQLISETMSFTEQEPDVYLSNIPNTFYRIFGHVMYNEIRFFDEKLLEKHQKEYGDIKQKIELVLGFNFNLIKDCQNYQRNLFYGLLEMFFDMTVFLHPKGDEIMTRLNEEKWKAFSAFRDEFHKNESLLKIKGDLKCQNRKTTDIRTTFNTENRQAETIKQAILELKELYPKKKIISYRDISEHLKGRLDISHTTVGKIIKNCRIKQ